MRPIDADAVKDVIAELNENGYDISPSDLAFVRNILLRMPTIEPKKAKWHKRNNVNFSPFDGSSEYEFTCGWCGSTADSITNYCPNCGAKMSGDIEDSE